MILSSSQYTFTPTLLIPALSLLLSPFFSHLLSFILTLTQYTFSVLLFLLGSSLLSSSVVCCDGPIVLNTLLMALISFSQADSSCLAASASDVRSAEEEEGEEDMVV